MSQTARSIKAEGREKTDPSDEKGTAVVLGSLIAALALIACLLAVDAGLAFTQQAALENDLDSAANDALAAVDVAALTHTGEVVIDAQRAREAVETSLTANAAGPLTELTVEVSGTEIRLSATAKRVAHLLPISTRSIKASVSAQLETH